MKIDKNRISTCSISFINHEPEKAFEIIADAGFKKVDILERTPHFSLFEDECDPKKLLQAAKNTGIKIANIASYVGGGANGRAVMWSFHGWTVPKPKQFTKIGFASDDKKDLEKEMDQMKKAIDLGAFLGARTVRVFDGDDKPESINKMVEWFQKSAEYAAEREIYLTLENECAEVMGTPKLINELAEKVGSKYFGILYEPGNLVLDTGADYKAALETMKNHITHCHFKDVKPVEGGRDGMNGGYEMQNFGEGIIDFVWIMEKLNEIGYDGDVALEYEMHDVPAEKAIRKFYTDFLSLFK